METGDISSGEVQTTNNSLILEKHLNLNAPITLSDGKRDIFIEFYICLLVLCELYNTTT